MFFLCLFALLSVSVAQEATIPPFLEQIPTPIGPGIEVCHKWINVSYNTQEERTWEEVSTGWCWDLWKGFRCEMHYQHREMVPVIKQHEYYIALCCEGFVLVDRICVDDGKTQSNDQIPTIDQPSIEKSPEVTVPEVDEGETRKEKIKELEEMLDALEKTTDAPVHEKVAKDEQTANPTDDKNLELQQLQLASILFRELIKPAPSTEAPTVPSQPVKEPESTNHLSNDAEIMALQAVQIVGNEILKSIDTTDAPLIHVVALTDAPSSNSAINPIEESEAPSKSVSAVQNLLMQTMTNLTEVLLHSLQQLQQMLRRLHGSGPSRKILD